MRRGTNKHVSHAHSEGLYQHQGQVSGFFVPKGTTEDHSIVQAGRLFLIEAIFAGWSITARIGGTIAAAKALTPPSETGRPARRVSELLRGGEAGRGVEAAALER